MVTMESDKRQKSLDKIQGIADANPYWIKDEEENQQQAMKKGLKLKKKTDKAISGNKRGRKPCVPDELNGQHTGSPEIKKASEEFWTEYVSGVKDRYFKKGYTYKCWETGIEGMWGHHDKNGNVHSAPASRFRKFETVEWWMLTEEERDEEERKFIDRVSLEVIDELQPDSKKQIIDNPDDDYHFGLGLYIRNKYIHGKEEELPFTFFHADYLSGKIINRIIERLREGYQ